MEGLEENVSRSGREADLIVIGGGPAGTSAAITAARRGARVRLLERCRLPRQRVCGEFISAESLELLGNLLGTTRPELLQGALRISEARLFLDRHAVVVPLMPAAASVARWDLDAGLWRASEESGVAAQQSTVVGDVSGHGPFVVATSAGEFRARAVVTAAGRWSNLRRRSDSGNGHKGRWLGIKGHFAEEAPPASVDLYFFEGGYCGVQPARLAGLDADNDLPGRINVCAMVRAMSARTLSEVFRLHPELASRARTWRPLMEPLRTSPLIFETPQPLQDGLLAVGDAAGFVDPFVGEGISLALRSGATAAECLEAFFRGQATLEDARAEYARRYESHCLPVFRNSSKIRRLLRLPRPLRSSLVQFLEKAPAVTRYLVSATR
jgi:flavin-dependent dehydrogenase